MPSSVLRQVRLLDNHTVNQIAAGEVVERPASAVKELLENALDAGASRIEIDLVDAGRTLIRVSDDGCGMTQEDAELALQRHATSKIITAEDLSYVRSLGFRGEAVPSIASVSRFRLSTGVEDGVRTILTVDGGVVKPTEFGSGPKGTEVTVEELFFNTPARLKFLKTDGTELGQCIETVSRYAIAYPSVSIRLTHNGTEVMNTNGSGDMLDAIAGSWGRELSRSLAEIDTTIGGIRLSGFVSPPHVTRHTRAYQYLSVNGRPVRTRTLTIALDQAYRDITPDRRFPVVALNLEVDPARIDVNVSPTKSEVKFQQEGQAFEALRIGIKHALMEHGMMPNAAGVAQANEALAQVAQAPSFAHAIFSLPPEPGIGMPAADVWPEASEVMSQMAPTASPSPSTSTERFPFGDLIEGLRIIGQAMNTFIIAETSKAIVLVDQHVAHERILYEYLCGIKGSNPIEKQPLLVPMPLHLDKRSYVLIKDRIGEIEALGYDLDSFGGESYIIRSAPAALRGKDPVKMLQGLIEELVESSITRKLVPTREQIWITSSCRMAVKAGDPLSHSEMERLIVELASTENPYLCPHGRPITITLTRDDLFRKFKRT